MDWNIVEHEILAEKEHLDRIRKNEENTSLLHIQYEPDLLTKQDWKRISSQVDIPVVVTLHEVYKQDPFSFPYNRIYSSVPGLTMLKKWIYRRRHPKFAREQALIQKSFFARFVQVHYEFQKQTLVHKGMDADKIHVIPHGVKERHPVSFQSKPGIIQFGTFGFLNPSLDYEFALRCLAKLEIPWKYSIGGGPRLPEHRQIADSILHLSEKLKIRDKIEITGYLSEDEMDTFLQATNIYLAPFKFKSSSGSLMHAISYGLPVIAPDLDIIREINQRVPLVEIYRLDDEQDFRKALTRISNNTQQRKRLMEHSRHYAEEYSFKNEAVRISEIYKNLLENKHE